MEVRHLRYFVALAEELHFGRAAERLCIAQPPLSQQIKQLEDDLGIALFIRSHRRVELTEAGRALLVQARRALTEVRLCHERVMQVKRGELGQMTIGFVQAASVGILPSLIPQFKSLLPHVELRLLSMSTVRQLEAIKSHEIDIGFLWLPVVDDGVVTQPLVDDRWCVVVRSRDEWSSRKSIRVEELAGRPIVFCERRDTPAMYDETIRHLSDKHVVLDIVQEADSFGTLINLVAIGMGIGLVPSMTTKIRTEGVVYLAVEGLPQKLRLAAAHLPSSHTPPVGRFLSLLGGPPPSVAAAPMHDPVLDNASAKVQ